jgi:hypothetical protein
MWALSSRKGRILIGASASLALAAAVLALASAGTPASAGPGQRSSELAAIRDTFASAENVYEAMFAPPPAHPMPKAALEDNAGVTPVATLDRTRRHALLTTAMQTTIESRGLAALAQVYTPAMVRSRYRILAGVVGTLSSGQDLLGGGGATVVKYLNQSIGQSSAVITAAVRQWTRIGYVNPQTGKVSWQTNHAIVIVTDSLQRTGSSKWLVSSRTWQYAPGQGP